MGLDWTISHRERSNRGEITASSAGSCHVPGGQSRPQRVQKLVREVHRRGADGVKLRGATGRDGSDLCNDSRARHENCKPP